jgi:hypothetical protein
LLSLRLNRRLCDWFDWFFNLGIGLDFDTLLLFLMLRSRLMNFPRCRRNFGLTRRRRR